MEQWQNRLDPRTSLAHWKVLVLLVLVAQLAQLAKTKTMALFVVGVVSQVAVLAGVGCWKVMVSPMLVAFLVVAMAGLVLGTTWATD